MDEEVNRDRIERIAALLLAPSSTVPEAVDRALELCAEIDRRCGLTVSAAGSGAADEEAARLAASATVDPPT